jgi:hypothetical protein
MAMMARADGGFYRPVSDSLPRYALRDLHVGGQGLFFYVHFGGFWEFAEYSPMQRVSEARALMSSEIHSVMNGLESNGMNIEWADGVGVGFYSRATPWKLNEICAKFGEAVLRRLDKVKQMYQMDKLKVVVLVYRPRDNYAIVATRRNVFRDMRTDMSYHLEGCLGACKSDAVNYTTLRKEVKVPNTSKLRTAIHPEGHLYDLFLVV